MTTGLKGILALGSNGEAGFVDEEESDRVVKAVRAAMPADRLLLVGAGRESTRATMAAARRAADLGADAVLIRTPSFFKSQMTSDAFIRHYTEVADNSPVPLLLYNVTMYTGVNLLPDAVEKLSEHPNIAGLKDSGNDMLQIFDYLTRAKPGFTVLAGAAPTLFNAATLGVHGAVLALAGLVPELCAELFELDRVELPRLVDQHLFGVRRRLM